MSEEIAEMQTPDAVETVSDQTETEAPETTEEAEEQPKDKDPWYRRRIDELTREKHEARRQAERLEKALATQQAMLERYAAPQEQAPQQQQIQPPDPNQYSGGVYDPRYVQDMFQYNKQSAVLEARQAIAQEWQQREEYQRQQQTQQRIANAENAARQQFSDYDAVIETITSDPNLAGNPTIRQAVLELENGPMIAYQLGKNPELAYEIARLPPIAAGMKLAQIINGTPSTSKAPQPIKPLHGTSASVGNKKAYSEMTTAEFIAARNAEERKAKEARYKR